MTYFIMCVQGTTVQVCRSEDNFKEQFLSFNQVGPGNRTQVTSSTVAGSSTHWDSPPALDFTS